MKPPSRRRADRRLPRVALLPLFPLLLVLPAVGCRGTVDVEVNERLCTQTYEFGNYGCAVVRGRVLGSEDQPLGGVVVHPRYLTEAEGAAHTTPSATTDAEGRFELRVTRMVQWPGDPMPNVFPINIVATLLLAPGASPLPRDSVRVELELAPIGALPTPAEVEIRLPYP